MSYLSTVSPAGCSQERVMDVGDWEGEVKLVGVDGTGAVKINLKDIIYSNCTDRERVI